MFEKLSYNYLSIFYTGQNLSMSNQDDKNDELPLEGGRVTEGVIRIGDTVHRPTGPHSDFCHELLLHLEKVNFNSAPRFLGFDEMSREILNYFQLKR